MHAHGSQRMALREAASNKCKNGAVSVCVQLKSVTNWPNPTFFLACNLFFHSCGEPRDAMYETRRSAHIPLVQTQANGTETFHKDPLPDDRGFRDLETAHQARENPYASVAADRPPVPVPVVAPAPLPVPASLAPMPVRISKWGTFFKLFGISPEYTQAVVYGICVKKLWRFKVQSTLPKSNPFGKKNSFDLEKICLMWGQKQ